MTSTDCKCKSIIVNGLPVTGIRNKLKDTALTLAIKSKNVELASLILDKNPDLGNCPNVLNLA